MLCINKFFVYLWMASQKKSIMPKMHISKSAVINAPVEKVFNTVNDFHTWSEWSPWLIAEPEAKVNVASDGKYYEWIGNRVGTGEMKVAEEKSNEHVHYDLTFLKPWKSKAKTSFYLKPKGNGTEITWVMDSSLPFFMFWMKKQMEAFVGMDYDRGLAMLKDYVEDGKVHSALDFKGESTFPGTKYVGIKRETSIDNIGPDMQSDIQKLGSYFEGKNSIVGGPLISIYHKWDPVKGKVSYTSAVPVKEIPDDIPAGMLQGSIPATKTYSVMHKGPYGHLGNAWTTLSMMQRNKEIKCPKNIHPWEIYHNNPHETPEKELLTEIVFPLK